MTTIRTAMTAAALLAAAPAAAQTVSAANPQSVASAMQATGFQAKLTTDKTGDPMIESALDGSSFLIFFYGCTAGKACQTIQFYAGFKNNGKATVARMNEWNRDRRFGRGYIDKENDPVLEMDVDLDDGGMSRALFEDNFEFWQALLPAFKTHING